MNVGLLYNHKCGTCGVAFPNNRMRRSRGRWQCEECARQAGLDRNESKGLRGLPQRKKK